MKHIINDAELERLVTDSDVMYEKGLTDMWNIIRTQIEKYFYRVGKSDNNILIILDSIKDQAKIDYNEYYQYPTGRPDSMIR